MDKKTTEVIVENTEGVVVIRKKILNTPPIRSQPRVYVRALPPIDVWYHEL